MAKDEEGQEPLDQDGKPIVGYVGNQRENVTRQVEEEGLTAETLDPTDPYVAVHLLGAGTILPGGTYGPPLEDPLAKRTREAAQELDTHDADPDQSPGIKGTKSTGTKATPAKKAAEPA